jgi:FKBP-type peptidyl-prolyl cis-trans isomerase FklB
MKKLILFGISISFIYTVNAQKRIDVPKPGIPTPKMPAISPAASFKSSVDSFSYALGVNIGESLKQAGVENINSQLVAKALNDVYGNKKTSFPKEQCNGIVQQKIQEYKQKSTSASKAVGQAFLAKNKTKKGVIALPNGLQYEVQKEGEANGAKPKAIDTVVVNYIGTLTNGTEFDNSFKRGAPASFPLNGVIRGWTEILQLMPKGSKWKVYIPSELAYGENPPSAQIPPNAVLIFEISLEDIKPAVTETK